MKPVVILDSGPLGMLCAPTQKKGLSKDCQHWLLRLINQSIRVVVPEIADYEIRRELIRADLKASLSRLDTLVTNLEYLPISTVSMRQAAEFWAHARIRGTPTANDTSIDADMILAGQALTLDEVNYTIATTNVRHLKLFANAADWSTITFS